MARSCMVGLLDFQGSYSVAGNSSSGLCSPGLVRIERKKMTEMTEKERRDEEMMQARRRRQLHDDDRLAIVPALQMANAFRSVVSVQTRQSKCVCGRINMVPNKDIHRWSGAVSTKAAGAMPVAHLGSSTSLTQCLVITSTTISPLCKPTSSPRGWSKVYVGRKQKTVQIVMRTGP